MNTLNHLSKKYRAVQHEYGADTKRLLHHVYNTAPMRATIPGNPIDFSRFVIGEATQARTALVAAPELSKTQQKKADDAKAHLRGCIASKAAARQAARIVPLPALNEEELAAMEEITRILSEDEDQAPMDLHGEMIFSPEFWSSEFRREHGLS